MSKPYDAAAKELFELDPAGWAALLGVTAPPDRIRLIDSELSTASAAADKVVWVDADPPFVLDVEFQSGRDPDAPAQLLMYSAVLHRRRKVPVRSVLVVLAPSADSPAYSGEYGMELGGRRVLDFRYDVVKVWELPHAALLAGPLATLPLAPVADVPAADAEGVFRRAADRLRAEADPGAAGKLLTALGILLVKRYGEMTAEEWMTNYPELRVFRVYRALDQADAVRETVRRQGRKKFGEPTAEQSAALDARTDLAALESLAERLLDVATWDELLAAP
jgi:hypothetical protein